MRALWLPDVLRAAGLRVIVTAGWETRGKELDAIEGVGAHHTASPPTSTLATNLAVVTNGNAVAPGPIAQLLLWRDGTFYVIAAGRANHAGAGGPLPWLPASVPGVVSPANRRTLGIEAVNNGVGELWAPDMLDAYEIGTAAILREIGQPVDHAFTHHEWAPTRKIDPAGPTGGRIATLPGSLTWSGPSWRARVYARLNTAPPPTPGPPIPTPIPVPEEDPMPRLIRVIDDAAVLIVDGTTASWGVSADVLEDLTAAGILPAKIGGAFPIALVPRRALRGLHYRGPLPDYTGTPPGLPGRTRSGDFASHTP